MLTNIIYKVNGVVKKNLIFAFRIRIVKKSILRNLIYEKLFRIL